MHTGAALLRKLGRGTKLPAPGGTRNLPTSSDCDARGNWGSLLLVSTQSVGMPSQIETSSEGYIVSTDDGRTFYCAVAEVGGARERRWIFIGASRQLYVGPR